jgi:Tfp pilus assembly protein PilO
MTKLLITIVFIVSSLVGGFYLVHPNYEKYRGQMRENEVLLEELEGIVIYVAQLKEIRRKINENEDKLAEMEKAFPEDHDAPSFFLYLKERTEDNNLKIEQSYGGFTVKPYREKETDHGRIKEVGFKLEFSGEYENTKNFFREIERLIRIINIENISISGNLGDPFSRREPLGDNFIHTNISGSTYSY